MVVVAICFCMERRRTRSKRTYTLVPYTTRFPTVDETAFESEVARFSAGFPSAPDPAAAMRWVRGAEGVVDIGHAGDGFAFDCEGPRFSALLTPQDRKSTRLNSSH